MNELMITTALVGAFTAGTVLFYALSVIETGTRRLMRNAKDATVSDAAAREVLVMLKRVVPRFPPIKGVVVCIALIGLSAQVSRAGWVGLEGAILVLYVGLVAWIVGPRNIKQSVRFIKQSGADVPSQELRYELGRVIGSHHLGLLANAMALVLQLWVILSTAV